MVWKGRLRRTEGTNSPWITLKMKFTWSFNEIRDKPSSNGIRHRSSQRRPKLTLLLPLTRASRCRLTSDRWDVVWEIKYWGLRTINIIIFYLLTLLLLINKPNKEYSSLLYFFVFRNEFIDLVLFLARLRYPVTSHMKGVIDELTPKHTNTTKMNILYLVYWSKRQT